MENTVHLFWTLPLYFNNIFRYWLKTNIFYNNWNWNVLLKIIELLMSWCQVVNWGINLQAQWWPGHLYVYVFWACAPKKWGESMRPPSRRCIDPLKKILIKKKHLIFLWKKHLPDFVTDRQTEASPHRQARRPRQEMAWPSLSLWVYYISTTSISTTRLRFGSILRAIF